MGAAAHLAPDQPGMLERLDVFRGGRQRDREGLRELADQGSDATDGLEGLPDAQKKWANEKTVYTHGYGMIAAYGNQKDAQDQPVNNDGEPVFAEEDLPPEADEGWEPAERASRAGPRSEFWPNA